MPTVPLPTSGGLGPGMDAAASSAACTLHIATGWHAEVSVATQVSVCLPAQCVVASWNRGGKTAGTGRQAKQLNCLVLPVWKLFSMCPEAQFEACGKSSSANVSATGTGQRIWCQKVSQHSKWS